VQHGLRRAAMLFAAACCGGPGFEWFTKLKAAILAAWRNKARRVL